MSTSSRSLSLSTALESHVCTLSTVSHNRLISFLTGRLMRAWLSACPALLVFSRRQTFLEPIFSEQSRLMKSSSPQKRFVMTNFSAMLITSKFTPICWCGFNSTEFNQSICQIGLTSSFVKKVENSWKKIAPILVKKLELKKKSSADAVEESKLFRNGFNQKHLCFSTKNCSGYSLSRKVSVCLYVVGWQQDLWYYTVVSQYLLKALPNLILLGRSFFARISKALIKATNSVYPSRFIA